MRVAALVLAPVALLVLLTVSSPGVLPPPPVEPVFDGASAASLAEQLTAAYPARVPGTTEAQLASGWYRQTMAGLGLSTEEQVWREAIPGLGVVELRNVVTVVRGRSASAIVVVASRDNHGPGSPSDNASGTAALLELARSYGALGTGRPPVPQRTLVLVSTDGGSWGAAGATHFAERSPYARDAVAAVVLDRLGRPGRPRLGVAAGAVASPARALVSTAVARVEEHTGSAPELPSALAQLVDLGVPYAATEQGPFLTEGISAVTISTADPGSPSAGSGPAARRETIGALGRAAEALVGSVDVTPRRSFGTPDALFLEDRVVSGWALRLLLAAAVAPFAVGVMDLLARGRRRRLAFRPALRALRSRLVLGLSGVALLWIGAGLGFLPTGSSLPVPATAIGIGSWTPAGVLLLALSFCLAWLLARSRLAPVHEVSSDTRLAGYTVALTWLAAVAVVTAITRPYALVFVVPSLYAWLWLPLQRGHAARVGLYLLGLAGPVTGLAVFASSLGLGPIAAMAYVAGLITVGYIPLASVLLAVAWVAAAAQLGALAFGRYAPYASGQEPPPPGLVRTAVGRLGRRVVAARQTSAT